MLPPAWAWVGARVDPAATRVMAARAARVVLRAFEVKVMLVFLSHIAGHYWFVICVEKDDLEFVLSDDLEIRLISVADCAIDHRATNDAK